MCVFNGGFMRLGPNFRQSQVILLFSSACFVDIVSSMYPQILEKYF